jgi:hypothetical protein
MLYIMEPVAATLAAHSDSVRILADISGDGTSNGAIMTIVKRVILGIGVILAGFFAVMIARTYMEKDNDKTKKLMDEAKNFVLAEGLVAVVWVIAELAGSVFQGAVG